jgi:DNA-binding transcriptional MocR family regulator
MRSLDGDVIYVGTFSKRLIPALRTGFVVCPAPLKPRLSALKHAVDLGNSDLMQHALAEFLERGYLTAHLARTLPEYRRRRDALEEALRLHAPGWLRLPRAERGVMTWLPLPSGLDPRLVFEEAHRKGVLVSPSTLNMAEDRAGGGVRLTFCAEPLERIVEGARRLGRALHGLEGRRATEGATGFGAI